MPAEGLGVHHRAVGAHHALLDQPVDAPLDRRRRRETAEPMSQEGAPGILLEQRNDLVVDRVHRGPIIPLPRNESGLQGAKEERIIR